MIKTNRNGHSYNVIDIGFSTGALIVLEHRYRNGRSNYFVRCEFCAKEKWVVAGNFERAKSCGCLTKKIISQSRTRHGQTDSPTWRTWKAMLDRCEPSHKSFWSYAGRGITICDRWRIYENFFADMGVRPDGTQLDRINNDGNYEPSNCRWVTPKKNANNRRSNRRVQYLGENLTLSEWSERVGMRSDTLTRRLDAGWSIERALTTPVRPYAEIRDAGHKVKTEMVKVGDARVARYSL